jgi:hypothetical protein
VQYGLAFGYFFSIFLFIANIFMDFAFRENRNVFRVAKKKRIFSQTGCRNSVAVTLCKVCLDGHETFVVDGGAFRGTSIMIVGKYYK